MCIPSARTASVNSPTMSRRGPPSHAFQLKEFLEHQLVNPSWCFEVSTTYLRPAALKSCAHCLGSHSSALNMGMNSAYLKSGPYVRLWKPTVSGSLEPSNDHQYHSDL